MVTEFFKRYNGLLEVNTSVRYSITGIFIPEYSRYEIKLNCFYLYFNNPWPSKRQNDLRIEGLL